MTVASRDCRFVIILSVRDDEWAFLERSLDSIMHASHPDANIVVLCGDSVDRWDVDLKAMASRDRRITVGPAVPANQSAFLEAFRLQRESYGHRDLLYIRCGVEVPPGWDERLQFSAYQDNCIGTASPLCDVSPLFGLVSVPVAVDLAKTDEILCRFAQGVSRQVPTFLASCVYVKREVIDAIWATDTGKVIEVSGDYSAYLTRAIKSVGYIHALCDHLYVQKHLGDAEQKRLERVCSNDVETANRCHPLTGLRRTFNDVLNRNIEGDELASLPAQLHVVHGWGGGLERWVKDFATHDKFRKNFILKAVGNWGQFGQRIELFDSPSMKIPIRVWELYAPVKSIDLANLQYRRILASIIDDYGIEAILISSMIGHSLDVLDFPIETILVFHDYLPFCPAISIFFGEVCQSCEQVRLERCFSDNELNQFFTNVSAQDWLDIRGRFFSLVTKNHLRFVVPTKSVEIHWKQLAPELSNAEFHVIPHGASVLKKISRREEPIYSSKLRVLVLGSLAAQKGGRLLKEALPNLVDIADFSLVGCGKDGAFFSKYPGVVIVPHYRRDELEQIVADFDPDLGLLASIVPETFSYTLSELIAMGIPPLVPKRGSFEDRVFDGETGFLYEPVTEALKVKIVELANDREKIEAIRSKLSAVTILTEGQMVLKYHQLIELPHFSYKRCLRSQVPGEQVLSVDPNATFLDVYREFGAYMQQKLQASPRFKPWQKRGLSKMLALFFPKRNAATAAHD